MSSQPLLEYDRVAEWITVFVAGGEFEGGSSRVALADVRDDKRAGGHRPCDR